MKKFLRNIFINVKWSPSRVNSCLSELFLPAKASFSNGYFCFFKVISVDADTEDDYRCLRDKYHILLMTSLDPSAHRKRESSVSEPETRTKVTLPKHAFFYSVANLMQLNKDAFTASNDSCKTFNPICLHVYYCSSFLLVYSSFLAFSKIPRFSIFFNVLVYPFFSFSPQSVINFISPSPFYYLFCSFALLWNHSFSYFCILLNNKLLWLFLFLKLLPFPLYQVLCAIYFLFHFIYQTFCLYSLVFAASYGVEFILQRELSYLWITFCSSFII